MRKFVSVAIITALGAMAATPAAAALKVGTRAPHFATTGALAGKAIQFNLAKALARGPVVLYFYPKAFTKGCTLEARAFSESMDRFRKAGAQVIGLSADDLPTLKKFSVEECRNAFPVGIATKQVIRQYDVNMPVVGKLKPMSNRTSYVIAPNGGSSWPIARWTGASMSPSRWQRWKRSRNRRYAKAAGGRA